VDTVKPELFDAEFNGQALPPAAAGQLEQCQNILSFADRIAQNGNG